MPKEFNLIADDLDATKGVRLLLGAEPIPPPAKPLRLPGRPLGGKFRADAIVRDALTTNQHGLEAGP